MTDDTCKENQSETLREITLMSVDTRWHILGLFEQLTEGLIILGLQMVVILSLASAFPGLLRDRSIPVTVAWLLYVGFSIAWVVRPIYLIRRELCAGFTKSDFLKRENYVKYCGVSWFLKTMAGLFGSTLLLGIVLWLF